MAANWKFELMLLELRAATVDPIQTIKILASGPSTRQINGANIGAVQVVSLR
jgi:hypothetical protein